MVLRKRSGYGFNGYHVPVIPRAPRSVRRRGSQNRAVEDGQICAFELLAAVAGKLLLETESSVSSNVEEAKDQFGTPKDAIKEEHLEGGKASRSEFPDRASCAESVFISKPVAVDSNSEFKLKKIPHVGSNSGLEGSSLIASSDFFKKVCYNVKSEIHESKNVASKVEGSSPQHVELCNDSIENGIERQLEIEGKQTGDLIVANIRSSKDPVELHVNTHALVNSDSSVQLPLYSNPVPKAYFPRHGSNVKVGIRDDDENSVGCNKPSIKVRAFKPQSRIGCRRIRKLMASKYWKAASKLKDYELSNTNGAIKPIYSKRKTIYTGKRYQHEAPSKRRKFFNHSSTIAYYREASSESISNSPEDMKAENGGSATILHRASGVSSSVISHQASFKSRDSHVKFSIKSIKVPELYIEVPETATVGLLKRTVMKAVTAILEGGLHVGVLLQGKKVRDDNRTLLQTGISQNGNLDSLSFTLEPSSIETSPLFQKDPPFLLPGDAHQELIRSPASPIVDSGFSNASSDSPPMTNSDNHVEKSNHELVPPPNAGLTDRVLPDSKALVAVPAMSVEALYVVPMNQKTRRSELGQRRTRRPFSVTEVEALVEAVEKLGTGRWRDVKLRAFDNADHRTYVDLKDKWKTLVHTASISPQQRRGEPVPQELLDRVLSAHSYWSQRQSKQHGKHQAEPFQISEAQLGADTV